METSRFTEHESQQTEPEMEPSAAEGNSSAAAGDGLAVLVDALSDYARAQGRQPLAGGDERQDKILQATCLALIAGPPELDLDRQFSPLLDQARSALRDVGQDDLIEARACRLWLDCAAGEETQAVQQFLSFAREPLWEPVRSLVYRALAHFGRRSALADLLPTCSLMTIAQADAWLEAAQPYDFNEGLIDKIEAKSDGVLPSDLFNKWMALLRAEILLALGSRLETVEKDFASLLSVATNQPARDYAETEAMRLAARAAAALARAYLAEWRDNSSVLDGPAGQLIPTWERQYLQSLARWQMNDCEGAIAGLESALKHNPHQTPIKLALAGLLAARDPEAALNVLEDREPTREMLTTRASLLAQLNRFDEMGHVIDLFATEPAIGTEPVRYTWAGAREQFRRRESLLQTALAERRGNWDMANKAWQAACGESQRKALYRSRQLFLAERELKSLPAGQGLKRSSAEQRFKRSRHEIGSIPLAGDSMFFRAAALIDYSPDRAIKDLTTLLRQRAWVEAERRAGGRRIIFAGDALLRLGQVTDAIYAYELVSDIAPPDLKERLAASLVYASTIDDAETEAISKAVERADSLAPSSPWPHMLAAMALLMAGESEAALSRLKTAEERGASDAFCRCLRSLGAADSSIEEEDLTALRLPDDAAAALRLISGAEAEADLIKSFISAFGEEWIARCPTDPGLVAFKLLTVWCNEARWDDALKFAGALERTGLVWAAEMAALVRLRRALDRAGRGEMEEADKEIAELEAVFQTPGRVT